MRLWPKPQSRFKPSSYHDRLFTSPTTRKPYAHVVYVSGYSLGIRYRQIPNTDWDLVLYPGPC